MKGLIVKISKGEIWYITNGKSFVKNRGRKRRTTNFGILTLRKR